MLSGASAAFSPGRLRTGDGAAVDLAPSESGAPMLAPNGEVAALGVAGRATSGLPELLPAAPLRRMEGAGLSPMLKRISCGHRGVESSGQRSEANQS